MLAFFKSILEQDTAPVVICDLNSVILYMNPAAIDTYHADLTGRNLALCHNSTVFTSRIEKTNTDIYMVALRDDAGNLIGYYEKHACRMPETEPAYHFV